MSGFEVILLLALAMFMGLVGGIVGALLVEAALQRQADNVLYETEFHEDKTEYDVPEWDGD